MTRILPENSWEIYLGTVEKSKAVLDEILGGRPMGPLLNQFIHLLVFQQGICVARWIVNNPDLVRRLNEIQSYTREEFDEIAVLIKNSVDDLIKV